MKNFLPWHRGKTRIANQLAKAIESIPHACYRKPFMGAAQVVLPENAHALFPRCKGGNDGELKLNGETDGVKA